MPCNCIKTYAFLTKIINLKKVYLNSKYLFNFRKKKNLKLLVDRESPTEEQLQGSRWEKFNPTKQKRKKN